MTRPRTVVAVVAGALKERGVRRVFGVPGGGAGLDVIAAAAGHGIEFVLAHAETAAAIMAATTAELSMAPGVVLTGVGPGAASAVNGVAYAALERVPLLLITDAAEGGGDGAPYQRYDQRALYAPLVKAHRRLGPAGAADAMDELLDIALSEPQGPVHLELSASDAAAVATGAHAPRAAPVGARGPVAADLAAAAAMLRAARRPLIVAGLEARAAGAPEALARLAGLLRCPVMATYKAKGVIADADSRMVGLFTGGAAEDACAARADLIVLFGLDPVELIPARWRYRAPVLALSPVGGYRYPVGPAVEVRAPLPVAVDGLLAACAPSDWTAAEIASAKDAMRRLAAVAGAGLTAQSVVEAVEAARPHDARITVDSGAHMFAAMAFTEARRVNDVMTSNGLSTMGHALPAAIASALHEPERLAIALTGDGGLMMCLGELGTAVRLGCRVAVVVFNDAALSLIDIKQQKKQQPSLGVRYPRTDFAAAARGLGCRAWRVDDGKDLAPALAQAFSAPGPALVDVSIDASGYAAQLDALRG